MARKETDNQRMKDLRRKMLLDSALVVFCKRGYEGTNIEAIAKQADCSHGLVYYYFKNKNDIFKELITYCCGRGTDGASDILNSKILSLYEKALTLTQLFLDNINKDASVFYQFYFTIMLSELNTTDEELNQFIKESLQIDKEKLPYNIVKQIIIRGQEENLFIDENPDELAILYMSIIQGLSMRKLYSNSGKLPVPFVLPPAKSILRSFIKNHN